MAVRTTSELWNRARRLIPGGVNSPVRAMRAIGRDPHGVAFVLQRERQQPADIRIVVDDEHLGHTD